MNFFSSYDMVVDIDDLLTDLDIKDDELNEKVKADLSQDGKYTTVQLSVPDEFVDEISNNAICDAYDSELQDELEERGYHILSDAEYDTILDRANEYSDIPRVLDNMYDHKKRDLICDILRVSHLTSKDKIKALINEEIDRLFK